MSERDNAEAAGAAGAAGLDLAFLHFIGATPEGQKRIQRYYLPRFAGCTSVLDLGCGEGDFLELLREQGTRGHGVDLDAHCCAEARARGLSVDCVDVLAYLRDAPSAQFDGVFCAHLVEHLPYEAVLAVVQGAWRVLRPGGRLVLATPNARSIYAHLEMYYKHFGHVSFYHPELLAFFLDYAGFVQVETGTNPELSSPEWGNLRGRVLDGYSVPFALVPAAAPPAPPLAVEASPPPRPAGGVARRWLRGVRDTLARWLVRPYLDAYAHGVNANLEQLWRQLGWVEQKMGLADQRLGQAEHNLVTFHGGFAATAERLGRLVAALEQLDASWECYATAVKPPSATTTAATATAATMPAATATAASPEGGAHDVA